MNSPFFDSERVAIAGPETLLSLVSNVADIAVIVTRGGIIEDMFWNIEDLPAPERSRWHGAMLADLVTEESRPKITQMLEDMAGADQSRWREVNHLFDGMDELPVRYQAISAGGAVLFMGRELRAVAALQSRLVDAQRALDRDYGQMRQLETRYRVLFQTSAEALVIVDGKSLKIREANAAAGNLLGLDTQDLVGAGLDSLFSDSSQTEVGAALDRLNTAGGTETVQARSAHRDQALEMRATIFRAAETNMLLCRLHAKGVETSQEPLVEELLLGMVTTITDAIALTDIEGQILWCNDAFLSLAEVALLPQIVDQSLNEFLGRPGVDLDVIIANARAHGRLRAFSSVLRGAFGSQTQVEISVAALVEASPPVIGFIIRDISRPDQGPARKTGAAAESMEQMMQLVGSVPLKELVRASTEEIEKMCIETALRMTGNNRASAAEMLGLSRQSLYVKLRRFGLIDQNGQNGG